MQTDNRPNGEPRSDQSLSDRICNGLTFIGLLGVIFWGVRNIMAQWQVKEEMETVEPENIGREKDEMNSETAVKQDFVTEPAPEVDENYRFGEYNDNVVVPDSATVVSDSLFTDTLNAQPLPAGRQSDEMIVDEQPADTVQ